MGWGLIRFVQEEKGGIFRLYLVFDLGIWGLFYYYVR